MQYMIWTYLHSENTALKTKLQHQSPLHIITICQVSPAIKVSIILNIITLLQQLLKKSIKKKSYCMTNISGKRHFWYLHLLRVTYRRVPNITGLLIVVNSLTYNIEKLECLQEHGFPHPPRGPSGSHLDLPLAPTIKHVLFKTCTSTK